MSISRLFATGILIVCARGLAPAQVKGIDDLSAQIAPHSKITYLDAVKLLFTHPSIENRTAENRTVVANETIPIGLVYSKHGPMRLTGEFEVTSVEAVKLRTPLGFRLILGFGLNTNNASETDFGGGAYVVGLFQVGADVKLLDALDVKTDAYTGLGERFPISRNRDAFSVSSNHSNSGESYETISTYFVFRNKLSPALWCVGPHGGNRRRPSEIRLLRGSFLHEFNCDVERRETARFFRPVSQRNTAFGVGLRIRFTKEVSECKTPSRRSRTYTLLWTWDESVKKSLLRSGRPAWLNADRIRW
ncbi:MAG TPA: hypothetical protein VLZ81_13115 [Blastocatellia bacterium]|nr:hypothetical protein [Blastocatellia bacterium]